MSVRSNNAGTADAEWFAGCGSIATVSGVRAIPVAVARCPPLRRRHCCVARETWVTMGTRGGSCAWGAAALPQRHGCLYSTYCAIRACPSHHETQDRVGSDRIEWGVDSGREAASVQCYRDRRRSSSLLCWPLRASLEAGPHL